MFSETGPPVEKRHSGRSGPTSPEGKAVSSQNAVKHGGTARTLILAHEFLEDWLLLHARWHAAYQPAEGSLEADFVRKAALAEWHRIRAQHAYDDFLTSTGGLAPHQWDADQVKSHDLSLRYKNAAERTFQRDYRALEQHIKTHRPEAAPRLAVPSKPASPVAESKVTAPFRQDLTVTLAAGKPQIDCSPCNESLFNWATETARPGDSILRFFHFPEAVPTEFDWLFPDAATRVPGAIARQYMNYQTWRRLNTAELLHPSGLPLDHEPFKSP